MSSTFFKTNVHVWLATSSLPTLTVPLTTIELYLRLRAVPLLAAILSA